MMKKHRTQAILYMVEDVTNIFGPTIGICDIDLDIPVEIIFEIPIFKYFHVDADDVRSS